MRTAVALSLLAPLAGSALALSGCSSDTVLVGERLAWADPAPGALWSVIEAEAFAAKAGAAAIRDSSGASGGRHVTAVQSGEALTFAGVDLGEGAAGVQIRLASARAGGTVEVRLGGAGGARVATLEVPDTGGWALHQGIAWSSKWRAVTAPVAGAAGPQTVTLVFTHPAGDRVADVDFVRFLGPHRPRVWAVSPTGDDAAAGVPGAPLRSLDRAVRRLRPGDTLRLLPGTYRERLVLPATVSGTPSARITLKADAGSVLDGTGVAVPEFAGLVAIEADYATVSGAVVRDVSATNARGITGDGDFARIDKARVAGTQDGGVVFWDATGLVVNGCELSDTSRNNLPAGARDGNGGWSGGISVLQSDDVTITANVVTANHGDGIKVTKDIRRARIARNVVRDSWSMNVYLDNAQDSVVEENLSYATAERFIPMTDPAARTIPNGFGVADGDHRFSGEWRCDNPAVMRPGAGNTFQNNIAVNTRAGFIYGAQLLPCSGLKTTTVVNNTFVAQWAEAVHVARTDSPDDHAGSAFRNNILHTRTAAGRVAVAASRNDLRLEGNLLWRADGSMGAVVWTAGELTAGRVLDGTDLDGGEGVAGNVWGDPALVAAGVLTGDVARNHQLTARSPAVDRGLRAGAPRLDFFQNVRPAGGGVDIGAHELSAR